MFESTSETNKKWIKLSLFPELDSGSRNHATFGLKSYFSKTEKDDYLYSGSSNLWDSVELRVRTTYAVENRVHTPKM